MDLSKEYFVAMGCSTKQVVEKLWLQAAQKDPEARPAKIDELRRTYSTLQRGDLSVTKHMGLFQQPVKE